MMNDISDITELGKSILTMIFHNAQITDHDDLYHAHCARQVVSGIDTFLAARNLPEKERTRIKNDLEKFAQENFLQQCLQASLEIGITHDEEADREWFCSLYESGEYPG